MKTLRHIILLALLSAMPGLLLAVQPININTAVKEALMTIDGVGDPLAQAIIDHRQAHGDFGSVDELAEVKGIGPVILDEKPQAAEHKGFIAGRGGLNSTAHHV